MREPTSREPKGAAPSGLRSDEGATREDGASRAPGGEREGRASGTTLIRTRLTELLGIRYPVVQAAMGYVSGPRLTAATSNAGGLGLIASATMSLAELEKAIEETAGRTAGPFGVNLRADAADALDRIELIIDSGVQVASFALAPRQAHIARLKDAGVIVIP